MVSIQNVRSMRALQTKLTRLQQEYQAESKDEMAAGHLPEQAAAEERQAVVAECTRLLAQINDWLQLPNVKRLHTPVDLHIPVARVPRLTSSTEARAYLDARAVDFDPFIVFKRLMQAGHALLNQQGWISRSDSDVVTVVAKPSAAPSPRPSTGLSLCNALRFLCCCGSAKQVPVRAKSDADDGKTQGLLELHSVR